MLEKEIEKKVVDYAKANGWWTTKFTSVNNPGIPDRVFIKNGVVVFIEFKKEGEKLRKLQDKTIDKMCEYGAIVCVVDNVKEGTEILEACYHTYGGFDAR